MTTPRDIGLYVHIPFCRQRCHFCAFYLEVAKSERMEAFSSACRQEADIYRDRPVVHGRPLQSIYFGGGTPTALPIQQLCGLLTLIRRTWPTSGTVEVTVEAHPSTITAGDAQALADAGFNRISFGAESMDDEDFGPIGRPGCVRDTERAVAAARVAGFTNVNLDLMYGLPGQTLRSWTSTLQSLLDMDPAHISCYALTIEEGTKLAHDIARHRAPPLDEALQLEMESAAEVLLTQAGFVRYEISNYAKPGWASRHNLLYWTDQDYLGLGPSAQSYVQGVRFGNRADLTAYIELLGKGALPIEERRALSASEQERDAVVFGLRLTEGVPAATVERIVLTAGSHAKLARLLSQGLLESGAGRVRLTPLGQRFADTVAGELF
jgi:oxygen-independent coproporphyrinogen III oxidase